MSKKRVVRLPKGIGELIFPICQKFFDGLGPKEIAEWVREESKKQGKEVKLSRELVYPTLMEARRLGYIRFNPPPYIGLTRRVADFTRAPLDKVRVVNVTGPEGLDHVAAAASELAFDLIADLGIRKANAGTKRVEVHLGLGAGRTTMLVARHLGARLRSVDRPEKVDKLVVHALSSGFSVEDPLTAPVAMFSYFSQASLPVEFVSLFSEAVVTCKQYEDIKKLPGVREGFAQADKIEIVITSLASAESKTGLLNLAMSKMKPPRRSDEHPKPIGDVQFRPYSEKGPIRDDPKGLRAVTLFELDDFVRMTQKEGKYVILLSGPTEEGSTKCDALMPLLTNPLLRVWSHLCLDKPTAEAVVAAFPLQPTYTTPAGSSPG